VDYVAAVDAKTLKDVQVVTGPTVLAVAARVGTTRLIDNLILNE
jgi:pantothenate synthetase